MVSHFVPVDVVHNHMETVVAADVVVVYVFVECPFVVIVVVNVFTDCPCRISIHRIVCVPKSFPLMFVELFLIGFPREIVVASVDAVQDLLESFSRDVS